MRGHWAVGFFLFWAGHFFIDLLIGMWPAYKTLMGIDLATAGLMMACAGFFGDATQLYFGPLGDRNGPKRLILLSLFLILPMALIGQLPGIFLLPCLFLLYLGSGAFHPNGASLAATLKPERKGVMVSLFLASGYLGMACGPFTYRLLHHHLAGGTWPLVFPIALVFLIGLIYKAPPRVSLQRQSFWSSMRSLSPYRRPLIILWFSQVCLYGLLCSFQFLLPDLLQARGYGDGIAFGGAHFSLILGAALSNITLGWTVDRYSARRLIPLCGLVGLIALALFLVLPALPPVGLILVLLVLGGATWLINPLLVTAGQRIAPERGGAVAALLMGGAWCFSYFGPLLAGLIATLSPQDGPTRALAVLSLLLVVPTLLGLLLPRTVRLTASEA